LNNDINNKYKLKNEKEQIKYNLKIQELNILYKNKFDAFKFESKIEKANSIITLNEKVFNIYKSYNYNYYNAVNINNILLSYTKNKMGNEKMQKVLGRDYNNIIKMIKDKYNEGITIIKKRNELEELKKKIKEEIIKSKELSNMNIELSKKNEKKEDENNKLNEKLKQMDEELIKIKKEKEKMNLIIQENKEKINSLNKIQNEKENENNKLSIRLNKYKKYFDEEMQELEKFQKQNSIFNFDDSPFELYFDKNIVTNRSGRGLLKNIAVYEKDRKGYLVYQELNYNLIVIRIYNNNTDDDIGNNIDNNINYDKNIIATLEGHKNCTSVIRYYKNKTKDYYDKEYILSCDYDKLVIVWDINDNFNKKFSIKEIYKENIYDALILFNLFNKDYILLSSDNQHNFNEYCKLYELKENTPFIKNIYNTNRNKNAYLIPWLYKNKYYLISCCDDEISINNIFDDENYANLIEKPEGGHYCGFVYNDNYLCISDVNNNFIRIWNLVKKEVYKTIKFSAKFGYEMVQWNDKYTIIGCNECLIIIDIEIGEEVEKIEGNNGIIFGLKKIYDRDLGECLICSEDNNIISIYRIYRIEEEMYEDDEPLD